jgi:pyruvate/2-oxoacid:ferredoxin oxidoreductase alpha subunit
VFTEALELMADGNTAAAYATLQMWRCVIFPGFPITPSTKWLETIAAHLAGIPNSKRRVKLLEAEHAVADYLVGAAASCRDLIFPTATSSVGLDHMTETTRSWARAGSATCSSSTSTAPRRTSRSASRATLRTRSRTGTTASSRSPRGKQQIYDTMIQAPCLGMHPDVMTPVMPGYFGIKDSHRNARLSIAADETVNLFQDRLITDCELPGLLNGDTAFGSCTTSKFFQGFKVAQKRRLERAIELLPKIGAEFETSFGRPGLAYFDETGFPEDGRVDLAVVGLGPDFGTYESLRETWEKESGLTTAGIAIRLITPFPRKAIAERLAGAKAVLVVNHAHHHGRGHFTLDIVDALSDLPNPPRVVSAFAGMGGADVGESTRERMLDLGKDAVAGKKVPEYVVFHEGVTV